jgi:hypothetical protein
LLSSVKRALWHLESYARSFSALPDPGLQLQSNHRTGTQEAPRTYDISNAAFSSFHRKTHSSGRVAKVSHYFFFSFSFCSAVLDFATMRFLLHPRTTTVVATRLSKSKSLGNVKATTKGIISNVANDVSASLVDTPRVKVKAQSIDNLMHKASGTKAWGQQCSPDCGCVIRFDAVIDPDSQTFLSASYTAKTIVTVATTGTSLMTSTNKQDGQQQQQQQILQPMLTTKGRPMLKACECQTLHHLSQAVVHQLQLPNRNKVSQVQNMLSFQSNRSSLAFRQTVLTTQELPETDTHCFDVVEEALTALVKGHIPKPRRRMGQELQKSKTRSTPTHPSRRQWQRDDDHGDHDDDEALQFGQLWKYKDYQIEGNVPRVMSALMMFDTNHQEYHNNSNGGLGPAARPLPPADWVSYIDEIYNQEEEEERSA